MSAYPEAIFLIDFPSIALYGLFDFEDTEGNRYIVNNFTGTFGSSENIPKPVIT